ncbi:unnamed protein product [Gordionus sp. m RMFG-2023]
MKCSRSYPFYKFAENTKENLFFDFEGFQNCEINFTDLRARPFSQFDPTWNEFIVNKPCYPLGVLNPVQTTHYLECSHNYNTILASFQRNLKRYKVCLSYSNANDETRSLTGNMALIKPRVEEDSSKLLDYYWKDRPETHQPHLIFLNSSEDSAQTTDSLCLLRPYRDLKTYIVSRLVFDSKNGHVKIVNHQPENAVSLQNLPRSLHHLNTFNRVCFVTNKCLQLYQSSTLSPVGSINIQDCSSFHQSSYIPSDLLLSVEKFNGLERSPTLLLYDLNTCSIVQEIEIQSSSLFNSLTPTIHPLLASYFSNHPRCIAYVNGSILYHHDLRCQPQSVENKVLFDTNSYYQSVETESIGYNYSIYQSNIYPGRDHAHVLSTEHHLFLVDDRYINHLINSFMPILTSNGGITSTKKANIIRHRYCSFIDATTSRQEILLSASSHGLGDIVFYPLKNGGSASGKPFKANFPCLFFPGTCNDPSGVKLNQSIVSDIMKRVNVPVLDYGICNLSNDGLVVVQMSALGDLFYQLLPLRNKQRYEKERNYPNKQHPFHDNKWAIWIKPITTNIFPNEVNPACQFLLEDMLSKIEDLHNSIYHDPINMEATFDNNSRTIQKRLSDYIRNPNDDLPFENTNLSINVDPSLLVNINKSECQDYIGNKISNIFKPATTT